MVGARNINMNEVTQTPEEKYVCTHLDIDVNC